jgi:FtsP/CotA-like multicopper oxidase with cupredoxin domain
MAVLLQLFAHNVQATIVGVEGPLFELTAKEGYVSTPDGGSVYSWGYANGAGPMQYPGVTMIVNQNEMVTVNLTNDLSTPVSIVFPGQADVAATEITPPSKDGLLTLEAEPGGKVSYTFTADNPGTYIYQSGTRAELQVEMGLVGALIVRPTTGADHAYNHPDTGFDREYLFLLSEMDTRIHQLVEQGKAFDSNGFFPVYWFINGRCAPDTMVPDFVPWLPHQPYSSVPRMLPGEKVLCRVIGGGRDLHPFHHHGNHTEIIAKDGRLLESSFGAGPDLAISVFTIQSVPGETVDAVFEWTGEGLGWDIYGTGADGPEFVHQCNGLDIASPGFDPVTHEYCPDHGKPIPVILPGLQDIAFGGFYSGSPYLGSDGSVPPGEGGLNPNAGFAFMWHSHNEKEMQNFDIFPGGMMTMLIVEPPGTDIP